MTLPLKKSSMDRLWSRMIAVRQIFRENPGYLKLLGEPAIPEDERLKMIEEAFGGQAERYRGEFSEIISVNARF